MSETDRLAPIYADYAGGRSERWSLDNPGNRAMIAERDRALVDVLVDAPEASSVVLDLGCGSTTAMTGLAEQLAERGARRSMLGCDLLAERLHDAPKGAKVFAADGQALSIRDGSVSAVVASTLFSSILDDAIAAAVAVEIDRVLVPGGVVAWYDLRVRSPNASVRPFTTTQIAQIFGRYRLDLRSISLAPPIARRLGRHTDRLYTRLASLPPLRTHLAGAIIKPL